MGKLTGGSQILAGILLIVIGWIITSGVLAFLLDILGVILIIAGVIVGVLGLVALFRGGRRKSYGDY
jgi:hypothetical protein